jgi:hypothetical protein
VLRARSAKHAGWDPAWRCFSLLLAGRSVDFACLDEADTEHCVLGLQSATRGPTGFSQAELRRGIGRMKAADTRGLASLKPWGRSTLQREAAMIARLEGPQNIRDRNSIDSPGVSSAPAAPATSGSRSKGGDGFKQRSTTGNTATLTHHPDVDLDDRQRGADLCSPTVEPGAAVDANGDADLDGGGGGGRRVPPAAPGTEAERLAAAMRRIRALEARAAANAAEIKALRTSQAAARLDEAAPPEPQGPLAAAPLVFADRALHADRGCNKLAASPDAAADDADDETAAVPFAFSAAELAAAAAGDHATASPRDAAYARQVCP